MNADRTLLVARERAEACQRNVERFAERLEAAAEITPADRAEMARLTQAYRDASDAHATAMLDWFAHRIGSRQLANVLDNGDKPR